MKFSTKNYSIAGKRGDWPASKDISYSHYLTLPYLFILCHLLLRVLNLYFNLCFYFFFHSSLQHLCCHLFNKLLCRYCLIT